MFLAAPLAPRARLRIPPIATWLLLSANLAVAAWTATQTRALDVERAHAAARFGTAAADEAPRLHAVRGAALGAELAAITARDPIEALGYRTGGAESNAVSALFLHVSAAHVLLNTVALAAAGACLEQAWGAAAVLALFLGAGAFGIAFDARLAPPALLVGSSAGVAALLGACFVRFRHRRLPFGFVHLEYLRPRFGSFQIAVPVVGCAWLAVQSAGAFADAVCGDSGVAFVSHLAGAGLGIAAALGAEAVQRLRRPIQAAQLP